MSMIPFDDRDGFIWMNGTLVPWREARLHVLSHGLHYASSVFEGERVYDGLIFKLRQHTERLFFSAETLGLEIPYSVEEIDEACKEVVAEMNITNGYVRPVVWRGSEMMAVSAQNTKTNVAVAAWTWPTYYSREQRLNGIRMDWAMYKRPSPETIPCNTKAAGLYMICTLSKHKAESMGYADALMLDWRGYIAEATGANIFFVQGKVLHTPVPDCFLNGITRKTIINLAKKRKLKVVERHIKPDELADFDEAFLVGSAAEVTPISEIANHSFKPGNISNLMLNDYDDLVHGRIEET